MSRSAPSPAVVLAMELIERPTLSAAMRRQPLPADVLTLIKIAAGSDDAAREAAQSTGRDPRQLKDAAVLYLQSVALHPQADAYRILGVRRESTHAEVRQHLLWLMKWLHPDRIGDEWESAFAQRVLTAWDELKSPDRRVRYDRKLDEARRQAPRARPSRRRLLPIVTAPKPAPRRPRSRVRKVVLAVALCAVAAALLAVWIAPSSVLPDLGLLDPTRSAEAGLDQQ